MLAYGEFEAGSRDGAGCGKVIVVGDSALCSDRRTPIVETIIRTILAARLLDLFPRCLACFRQKHPVRPCSSVQRSHATGTQPRNSGQHYVFRLGVRWVIVSSESKKAISGGKPRRCESLAGTGYDRFLTDGSSGARQSQMQFGGRGAAIAGRIEVACRGSQHAADSVARRPAHRPVPSARKRSSRVRLCFTCAAIVSSFTGS